MADLTGEYQHPHEVRQRILVPAPANVPIFSYFCDCGWQGQPTTDGLAAEAAGLAHVEES